MKEKIYRIVPNFLQNVIISIFNIKAYRQRHGDKYNYYVKSYNSKKNLSLQDLKNQQKKYYKEFIDYTIKNSKFYRELFQNIDNVNNLDNIHRLPIISKEIIRKNIKQIYTIPAKSGRLSKTGGTTGKSLKVIFTLENAQERFAMLNVFRGNFGHKLGKKTAWFSGKHILTQRDIKKNRFWKTDYFYNIRFYSTFHIKEDYLKFYIQNLIEFKPEYLVGFPSTILDIAKYGMKHNIKFPKNIIKAVFPTAETVTDDIRTIIESYFSTNIYNQYASSEGAPFIFECKNKKLHVELLSGVFEVLDDNDMPAEEGRLVITSFTTKGTPLIRYDIGDRIVASSEKCSCGNNNPMVSKILGRIDDFIFSPQNGKINLGNVSNTLKDTVGIIKFQAIQNSLDKIEIKVEVDKQSYNEETKVIFLKNWRDRVGDEMKITLEYVDKIPVEKSGKFRLVKNNIKHLL